MRDVSQDIFRSLQIYLSSDEVEAEVNGLQMIGMEEWNIFTDLVEKQGPRLRTLVFDVLHGPSFRDKHFFKSCSGLRALSIDCQALVLRLSQLLVVCGRTLRKLHLRDRYKLSEENMRAISRHCTSLEWLTLSQKEVATSLGMIWRSLRLVQRVSLRRLYGPRLALYEMTRSCESLVDIELNSERLASAMLGRLGAQVRVLRFMRWRSCPRGAKLQELLAACPNARIHAWVTHELVETLRLLGGRLVEVRLDTESEGRELLEAFASCVNVEEAHLTVDRKSRATLEAFFEGKSRLRKVHVSRAFLGRNVPRAEVLDIIASRVSTLLEFECVTRHALDDILCAPLLVANRALRSLRIYNRVGWDGSPMIGDTVVGAARLMRAVAAHPALKQVIVLDQDSQGGPSQLIADACVRLRNRRIDVVVGNVQYLPIRASPPVFPNLTELTYFISSPSP